jgi:hypothetical protein
MGTDEGKKLTSYCSDLSLLGSRDRTSTVFDIVLPNRNVIIHLNVVYGTDFAQYERVLLPDNVTSGSTMS